MVSFSDIMKLRKEGRLPEAYEAARQLLALGSDDVWAKRAMMWVVYDYAKQNTAPDKRAGFLRCMHQMVLLQIPADEEMFYNAASILVRNVVRKCVGDPSATGFLTALWEELRQWNWTVPSKAYSGLLLSFLKVKDQWPPFADFCEWWNLDHLTDEDFKPLPLPDGNKDLPLAEKAYIAYSKALLRIGDRKRIRLWLPVLGDLVKRHPDYMFLAYYCVKLQLLSGEKNKAVDLLKPLVVKKSGEFWVWELIADAAGTDEERLSAYSKAMLCRSPEKMTVALRERVGMFLLRKGHRAEAKRELEEVVRIRAANKWRVPQEVLFQLESDELRDVVAAKDNRSFYRKYAPLVEDGFLGKAEVMAVKVVHINEEKRFVSFSLGNRKTGFFKEKNLKRLKSLHVGDLIEMKVEVLEEKRPSRVRSWRVIGQGR